MWRWILCCVGLIWGFVLSGQEKYSISGFVRDSKTGEELIGAAVSIKEIPSAGVYTNSYGFYSLSVPKGKYNVTVTLIGYEFLSVPVDLTKSIRQNFDLTQKITQLHEVTVTSEKRNDNVAKNQTGVEKLNTQEIKDLPAFFGERDVLKTLQLLPGIKSAGEGNSGFNVRGGSTDQNLILLDGATVYNPSHLMGFFSVFNPDAVKDVTMYKGSLPAEFGGRLSSVLDIRMNEGNNKKIEVNGGIGLISSRLTIDGPFAGDKGSFIISARRTYADLVVRTLAKARILKDSTLRDPQLYFYDLNAKANYRISETDRLFLSGYFGRDVLGVPDFGFDWGNSTATLRWNHLISDRLFLNTSLIFNDFGYSISNNSNTNPISIVSRIRDYTIKQDYQYNSSKNSEIKFGFESTYHSMVPGTISGLDTNTVRKSLPLKNSVENSIYFSHDLRLTPRLTLNYGLRVSEFSLLGKAPFYKYSSYNLADSAKSIVDSTSRIISYLRPEPRISLTYVFNDRNSVKASYTRNAQYLHLLSNSTIGNPTDLWIPSSNNTVPELSDQYAIGYYKNFYDNNYEFSAEVYYKSMSHQVDYINGAILTFNANVESQLIYGKGRAYGVELFLKKKYGRFNGWIGYTLSRTERQFEGINNGSWYPARQDRTHDISVVGIYQLPRNWTISSTWVYNTGNAVTFPRGAYLIGNRIVLLYSERNADRMPAYHRLDLSATKVFLTRKHYESSLTMSLYNAYARDNAYSITFRQNEQTGKIEAVQTTLFKLVPSVTYNFKF